MKKIIVYPMCLFFIVGCFSAPKQEDADKFYDGEETTEPWGARDLRYREICTNPTGSETKRMINWCKDNGFNIRTIK